MTTRQENEMQDERTEMAEVSAAKDQVADVLDDYLEDTEHDTIEIADRVVEALLRHGVLVPEWMPQLLNGKPAQGYYPTASQVEAWEGRRVTPRRVHAR